MRIISYINVLFVLFSSILFGWMLIDSAEVEMGGIAVLIYEISFFAIYFLILIVLSIILYRKKLYEHSRRLLISIPMSIIIIMIVFIISEKKMQLNIQARQMKFDRIENYKDSLRTFELIRLLDDSIKIDSRNAQLLINRGLIERKRGEYNKSISFYKKAILIDANNIEAYLEAGWSSIAKNDYKNALNYYEKVSKIDSNNKEVKKKIEWLKFKLEESISDTLNMNLNKKMKQ